jgi:hypothetical protein
MMNYQEQAQLNAELSPVKSPIFATIGAVYPDGVTLIFDGETAETTKRYRVNTTNSYAPGDRVKLLKISGTYVVEYIVGKTGGGETINPYSDALIICPFNNSLANLKDQTYNLNKATGSANPVYTDSTFHGAKCLTLPSGFRLDGPAAMAAKLNANFTLTAWIYYASTGTPSYPAYRRIFWANTSGYVSFPEISISGSTSSNKLVMPGGVTSVAAYHGAWHWICITRSANGMRLFIDRNSEIILSTIGASLNFTTGLRVSELAYALNGNIAYLCFWDRILTDAEMSFLWNNGEGNFAA